MGSWSCEAPGWFWWEAWLDGSYKVFCAKWWYISAFFFWAKMTGLKWQDRLIVRLAVSTVDDDRLEKVVAKVTCLKVGSINIHYSVNSGDSKCSTVGSQYIINRSNVLNQSHDGSSDSELPSVSPRHVRPAASNVHRWTLLAQGQTRWDWEHEPNDLHHQGLYRQGVLKSLPAAAAYGIVENICCSWQGLYTYPHLKQQIINPLARGDTMVIRGRTGSSLRTNGFMECNCISSLQSLAAFNGVGFLNKGIKWY